MCRSIVVHRVSGAQNLRQLLPTAVRDRRAGTSICGRFSMLGQQHSRQVNELQLDGECRVQKLCSARCPASACSVHASASRIGFPHGNNRQRVVRKSHNLLDYFGLYFQGLKMLLEYMLLLAFLP